MKLSVFIAVAVAGMAGTSVAVWSATTPSGSSLQARQAEPGTTALAAPLAEKPPVDKSSFIVGDTLMMEGRLGHAIIPSQRGSESFLFVDINADATKEAAKPAELNLAIVIDKSGSMRGKRLKNAVEGARTALSQLRDGDVVSVITYGQTANVIVSPTVITSASRDVVLTALNTIRARGETCISCGIDLARRMARSNSDKVTRIVLLSDGEATVGIQDFAGFTRIAEDCRRNHMAITTIGVDVDYNERIMAALARGSNGRHHFVDRPDQLVSIFSKEMESLAKTVAMNAEVTVELEPGVFVDEVFDRPFERQGNRLIVPLGIFAQNDRKTLLVRLRVPQGPEGERPIANVKFRYDDLAEAKDGICEGELIALATSDATKNSELDALVSGRLTQSETAKSLEAANSAFGRGDVRQARSILRAQKTKTSSRRKAAAKHIPMGRAGDFNSAFGKSSGSLSGADSGFAEAAPAREGSVQAKRNQQDAFELAE